MIAQFESVDFSNSFCTWLLQEQEGYGRFSIEAILRIQNQQAPHTSAQEEYVLLSQVIAGNVYGKQQLIIEPIYQFAALFGARQYKVFRTHFPFQAKQDSVSLITDRFKTVETVIQPRAAIAHQNAEGVIAATQAHRPLVAHMIVSCPNGQHTELIFPIKHINVQPVTGQFQVETGPILWPSQGVNNTQTEKWNIETLSQAYTIFNRFDEAEIAENTAVEYSGANNLTAATSLQARHFQFTGSWPVEIQIAELL